MTRARERRMRTRRMAWDLDQLDADDEVLFEGLPCPSRSRRRLTPSPISLGPIPSGSGGGNIIDGGSCGSVGHTSGDDSSIASACASPIPPEEGQQQQQQQQQQEEEQEEQKAGAQDLQQQVPSSLAIAKQERAEVGGGPRRKQRGKVALVVGMIRMNEAFMKEYIGPADPLLELHSARDTRRILCLEKELKTEVISLSDARRLPGVDHVRDGGKHVSCLFESPSLRDLQVRCMSSWVAEDRDRSIDWMDGWMDGWMDRQPSSHVRATHIA
jgi:hypothetical protein